MESECATMQQVVIDRRLPGDTHEHRYSLLFHSSRPRWSSTLLFPPRAQTQGGRRLVTTLGLSKAFDGTWQRLGHGHSQRDERTNSSLRTVVGGLSAAQGCGWRLRTVFHHAGEPPHSWTRPHG